jgi:hypothetical protein
MASLRYSPTSSNSSLPLSSTRGADGVRAAAAAVDSARAFAAAFSSFRSMLSAPSATTITQWSRRVRRSSRYASSDDSRHGASGISVTLLRPGIPVVLLHARRQIMVECGTNGKNVK